MPNSDESAPIYPDSQEVGHLYSASASSSTWYFGDRKREHHSVTFIRDLGIERLHIIDFETGLVGACGQKSSINCMSMVSSRALSWTAPSFALISIQAAAAGELKNAIGRSAGGVTTKIHAVVDSRGKPGGVALSGGNRFDCVYGKLLLQRCLGKSVIADRAYGTNDICTEIQKMGQKVVIPSK